MKTKKQLREHFRTQRQAMSLHEVSRRSEMLIEPLLGAVEWGQVKYVHTYIAREDWGELSPALALTHILERWPHIEITQVDSHSDVPRKSVQFDVIIVPVLAYDNDNYRLGMGRGWYDRFLAMQPQAQTIGLAYKQAKADRLPHEPHDVVLTSIVAV